MLSVVMLSVIMLNVEMVSVIMLNVAAPPKEPRQVKLCRCWQGILKGEVSLYC